MEVIGQIKNLVQEFTEINSPKIKAIDENGSKFQDACRKVERSWSGSFAGWHGRMYFQNFEVPSVNQRFNGEWGKIHGIPEGWREREPEEAKAEIEKLVGNDFSVDAFKRTADEL